MQNHEQTCNKPIVISRWMSLSFNIDEPSTVLYTVFSYMTQYTLIVILESDFI
jgi:hypothetical protein